MDVLNAVASVKKFQVKYRNEILGVNDRSNGTGYVYKATVAKINALVPRDI